MMWVIAVLFTFLTGCVAQQADLKQTEKALQQRIRQQDDQLSQTRARQSQEISSLRDQELPQLRGDLERALHQTQDLQAKQEDSKHRSVQHEQQIKKLEQLVAKMETDGVTRHLWVQKSLDNQDAKIAARLDEMTKAMDTMKRDIIDVVQRTNEALAKRVDVKLEEQQKGLVDNQLRLEQVSQKFIQFNQAMTGFKEALTGLHDRLGQEEQATKSLAARVDADSKTAAAHASEVNQSITSVAKALESVGQKVTSRFDEQDRRIDSLTKSLEQVSQKSASRQPATKQSQRVVTAPNHAPARSAEQNESMASVSSGQEQAGNGAAPVTTITAPQASPESKSMSGSAETASDRVRYEQVLGIFREGNLEGAHQGFLAFLSEYPNSDLAPNARYWLGEAYYGKKEFHKAIDAYDKVEVDYPRSEKVPAAILKKGFAYLALKDKKRASSAFKQVATLYPKSSEAGKATDKLAQLKEVR